jgi:hypothetical protein
MMSNLPLHCPKRAVQRLDYRSLNDGSDSEAETTEPSLKCPYLNTTSLQQDLDQFIRSIG